MWVNFSKYSIFTFLISSGSVVISSLSFPLLVIYFLIFFSLIRRLSAFFNFSNYKLSTTFLYLISVFNFIDIISYIYCFIHLALVYFALSPYLVSILEYWFEISPFLMYVSIDRNLPLNNALTKSHEFWYVVLTCSFSVSSKYYLIFLETLIWPMDC